MDKGRLTTIKVMKLTRHLAKILAAYYDVTLMDLIHRLVTEEIERKGLRIE